MDCTSTVPSKLVQGLPRLCFMNTVRMAIHGFLCSGWDNHLIPLIVTCVQTVLFAYHLPAISVSIHTVL